MLYPKPSGTKPATLFVATNSIPTKKQNAGPGIQAGGIREDRNRFWPVGQSQESSLAFCLRGKVSDGSAFAASKANR